MGMKAQKYFPSEDFEFFKFHFYGILSLEFLLSKLERIPDISSKQTICCLGSRFMMNSNATTIFSFVPELEIVAELWEASPSKASAQTFIKQETLNRSSSLLPMGNSNFCTGTLLLAYPSGLNKPFLLDSSLMISSNAFSLSFLFFMFFLFFMGLLLLRFVLAQ